MKHITGIVAAILLLLAPCSRSRMLRCQPTAKAPVLQALELEMARAGRMLAEKGAPGPYFLGYHAAENRRVTASASYGALRTSTDNRSRTLDIDMRVGSYHLDNTHKVRGEMDFLAMIDRASVELPLDDDVDAIRSRIWLETDKSFKHASERLINVQANMKIKVREEDSSDDFSRETPQHAVLPLVHLDVDRAAWEERIKRYSAGFNAHIDVISAEVTFMFEATDKFLVNSEGASLQHGTALCRLLLVAHARADDGMDLVRYEVYNAHSLEKLPGDAEVMRAVEKIAADLHALRTAPVLEPYTGPAILSGRASGVFFHEIFGHRIEGHRQKDDEEGQTFTRKINQSVLPPFISVYDDPTMRELGGVDLNGYYQFDDQGVAAQRVTVVDHGVLKNFLMSRSPVNGFEHSNGHGRAQTGLTPVGRQGNLIVQPTKTVTEARLREMLIAECKRQGKSFGLVVDDISGGFTFTRRGIPQAFNVSPIMVYRVYTDGRPDELVRGADLIGTPLTSFSKILAAGDTLRAFNGICGAESGAVPVGAVSPNILTSQIEIQKKVKGDELLPILPPPDKDTSN